MNNIVSTKEIKSPYRCLIRENAYFWIVNVDFEKGKIERVQRYGRSDCTLSLHRAITLARWAIEEVI